jgi:hypothetical protein
MNCHDFQELLQRQLDGEAVLQAEAHEHLTGCRDCRSLSVAAQALQTGLRAVEPPQPPESLARRTVLEVLRSRRQRLRVRWAIAAAAVAACLLAGVLYWRFGLQDTVHEQQVVHVEPPKPEPAREPKLGESIGEARQALDRLADKVLDSSRKQADVMRDALTPLEGVRAEAPKENKTTQPGMTTGLQTVAATTRRGLTFMLRETPPLPAAKKDGE